MKGLQAFVDSILVQPLLAQLPTVRKFFCLDEPPSLESGDDSRVTYFTDKNVETVNKPEYK